MKNLVCCTSCILLFSMFPVQLHSHVIFNSIHQGLIRVDWISFTLLFHQTLFCLILILFFFFFLWVSYYIPGLLLGLIPHCWWTLGFQTQPQIQQAELNSGWSIKWTDGSSAVCSSDHVSMVIKFSICALRSCFCGKSLRKAEQILSAAFLFLKALDWGYVSITNSTFGVLSILLNHF